jgi:TonB-linked SusC/RagA family outer membrane protein
MKKLKQLLLFSFIILGASLGYAQQSLSGSVVDGAGPLPGVTIIEKGTNNGTTSDFDGNYTLSTSGQDAVLVFTYIGFLTQEIPVGTSSTIDVQLIEDIQGLEEVVVTGYGTQKKATLTGSIATISGEALVKSASPNLGTALAGKVAGLYIDTGNGAPGADNPAIRIRGTNTFNNSSALIVIDGIPNRAGGLGRINPADIESISVLKDASAAIYGARAANGVILVTTKRGKKGDAKVKITSNYGWQNFTTTPDMLRGEEYMDLVNVLNVYKLPVPEWNSANASRGQAFTRPNGEVVQPTYSTDRIQNTALGADPWNYPNTDWMEEVQRRNAPTSRQNIQVTGGNEDVTYLASAGYLRQDVNFKNAPKGFTQYDLRLNLDAKINDFLSLDVGLYSRQEENYQSTNSPAGVFNDLVRQYPWFPAYWPTGEYGPDIENGNNPAIRVTDGPGYDDTSRNFVQSNLGVTLKVPGVEGLLIRGNISYDKMNIDYKRWERPWQLYTWDGINKDSSGLTAASRGPGDPSLRNSHTTLTDITATINVEYEKNLGDHYIKLLGGITREESEQSYITAFKRFFLSNDLDQLSFGGQDGQSSAGSAYQIARLNYYGRLNYNFKEKYLLEMVFRYDGSYLFPEDKRYGFFPGGSAGWVLSEEDFFKDNVSFIDFFKLKGSYGKLGNDNVAPFQFLASYGFAATGLGNVYTTAYETKVPNPNITWETQTSQNFGFDLRALNNRLSVGFEVFKNLREDILTLPNKTLPSYSGITPPAQNIGEFQNTGIEITLGYNGETNSGLTYNFSFNVSDSNNKLIFVDEPDFADRPWQRETGGEIGRPLLYSFDGVFRSQSEVDSESLDYSAIAPVLKPGDARVVDYNGDGKITVEDKSRVGGSVFADTQMGFNTALSYKNFDFNMFWNGAAGGFNTYEWSFMSGTLANVQRDVYDRAWSLDNTNALAPRLADRGDQWYSNQTDYALITRDFIRLKSLELGYNFPENMSSKIGAESIRLSVSGTNLITITDFPFDPEVIQNGVDINNTRNSGGAAVNNGGAYPLLKTITTGIQITF